MPFFAFAAEPETLRVGVTGFPPGIISDEEGHAAGPAAEMLLKILSEAGYRADIRVYPSVRVRALVASGELDMSIATKIWDADGIALFSKQPFGEQKIGLFWRDPLSDVASLAQVNGKSVIVPLGQFTPAALLKEAAPRAAILEARDFEGAIAMLKNGRANYLLDWVNPVQSHLALLGLTLRRLDLPPVYTYVVMGRRTESGGAMMERIDAVMTRLTVEGALPLR